MRTVFALGMVLLLSVSLHAQQARLQVRADQPGHAVPPTLWGIFFEDINLSADGGVYPELVRNRTFEESDKPDYWSATGDAELAVQQDDGCSAVNPRSLRLTVGPRGGGAFNGGYFGMAVRRGETYALSMMARAAAPGATLSVRVENVDGSVVYATHTFTVGSTWKKHEAKLKTTATDPRARLTITSDKPGTFWLDMVSVLPTKTFKGHGLREDLCQMLADLKPAFFRFPGGCWVEGDTMATAYRWKTTIGDPAERRQVWNIWGYKATNGLGYHEYLQLAEDLGAEPMFCINVGMSHKQVVPLDKMDEYVQDALDAIEYANGPVTSTWGALRAKAGHPEPFNMKYIEIGNENGGKAYAERWALFHKAIKAKYPDMVVIANVWGGWPREPMPDMLDEHYYNNPDFFIHNAGKYDGYDRTGPQIFVGEYAVTKECGHGNLAGAIGEAAFMTGIERNSDIVTMACYAPLFVNVNHRRWNPNLINFDSSRVFGLPSYYVQQLFAHHRGDVVLPVRVDSPSRHEPPRGGAIGVGTWETQAEFKDIKVTQGDKVLFASDFTRDSKGWRMRGGQWQVKDGALRQTDAGTDRRAMIGDRSWNNYTLTLKARKISGSEGFLISFRAPDDAAQSWWNLGGWGNTQHGLETAGVADAKVAGSIETGRWYDIRIEVSGNQVRCFLDGTLVHDVNATSSPVQALYASATREGSDVIVKVVNTSGAAVDTQIDVAGVTSLGPKATVITLTSSDPADENTLDQPTKIAPVETSLTVRGAGFTHTFPPHSFTVLRTRAE